MQRLLGSAGMRRVAVVGDTFADVLALGASRLPSWGKDTLASEIRILPGGSALNVACHMHNAAPLLQPLLRVEQPLEVEFFSVVGDDALGRICRDHVEQLGISRVKCLPGATTGSCIVISGCDDRAFVTSQGAMNQLSFDLVEWEQGILTSAQHVHIGGYYNCPRFKSELPEVLRRLKEAGATVSLNPQYDASERWDGFDEQVTRHLDVFIASLNEARGIAGVGAEASPEGTARRLCEMGIAVPVITLGAQGAIAAERTSDGVSLHRAHAATVEMVDATGAGDAFAAGFVSAWASTRDVAAALRFGCACGTAAVTVFGGSTAVQCDEITRIHQLA